MSTLCAPSRRATPPLAPAGVPLRRPEHPGCFLARQCLTPLAINQTAAARLLGISAAARQASWCRARRAMTADTAIRCALASASRRSGCDAGALGQLPPAGSRCARSSCWVGSAPGAARHACPPPHLLPTDRL